MTGARSILFETWQALATPRRSVPILLVGVPLLAAQYLYGGNLQALLVGVFLFAGFLLLGPAGWRLFVSQRPTPAGRARRLSEFGMLGVAVIAAGGLAVPVAMGLPLTFFTDVPSLVILLAMFWVGGWGLGRDIDQELELRQERERADRLERAREQAELLAIRSHLDPHFLFNALNAIAEWCREDPEVAEKALLRLATMLRTLLAGVQAPAWPLSEELELVDHLLAIHEVRDPERFQARREGWQVARGIAVPPLILLPLVENAMKHGPAAGHRGEVRIRVDEDHSTVRILIDNPGPFGGPREGGLGLRMVQRRLELAFDGAASVDIEGYQEDGAPRTRARLELPATPLTPREDTE